MISLISIHVITSIWWMRFVWHRSILLLFGVTAVFVVVVGYGGDGDAAANAPKTLKMRIARSRFHLYRIACLRFALFHGRKKTHILLPTTCQHQQNDTPVSLVCTQLDSFIFCFLTFPFRFRIGTLFFASLYFSHPFCKKFVCAFVSWFHLKQKTLLDINTPHFRRIIYIHWMCIFFSSPSCRLYDFVCSQTHSDCLIWFSFSIYCVTTQQRDR